jgi:hypothetical protein
MVRLDNNAEDEFVSAATFLFPDEAEVARGLLRSMDIFCYLQNEHTLAKVWPLSIGLGRLRLMVPASLLTEARETLASVISEGDLVAQEELQIVEGREHSFVAFSRGRCGIAARMMLAIAVLCAPTVDKMPLVYLFR